MALDGSTPADVRQLALNQLLTTGEYEAVILVDSDDILLPDRVSTAHKAMYHSDVNGCALHLTDKDGKNLDIIFGTDSTETAVSQLPYSNVFGMSNTAYRTSILRQCLPIPSECVLADWFLALRAWANGAQFSFDPVPRMAYRQHGNNIARYLPPFSVDQLIKASQLVLDHFHLILTHIPELSGEKKDIIESRYAQLTRFNQAIRDEQIRDRYLQAVNQLQTNFVWWSFVAHPALEEIWNS